MNTTTTTNRPNLIEGATVKYHGSLKAHHGTYRVERTYLTVDGVRCDLVPVDGKHSAPLGDVRFASVTVL
jgi:hypothetical protein